MTEASPMRIVFLGNNRVAVEVLRWLRGRDETVVGLVNHPRESQKYGAELIEASGLESGRIFCGSELGQPATLAKIKELRPDVGISVYFGYILKPEFLNLFPRGVINLHPALLPFNRGAHPNVWSIIEGTPIGATLHYMDAGVDTGDILAQRQLTIEPVDTGQTLYGKLERVCLQVFQEAWPQFSVGKLARRPQQSDKGTTHRVRDLKTLDEVDLSKTYVARDLINLLRARTFPPHHGAYFIDNGRKVYMQLKLEYEGSSGKSEHE